MRNIISLSLIFVLLIGCQDDNILPKNTIHSLKPKWSFSNADNALIRSGVKHPIHYDNNVLFATEKNGEQIYVMKNGVTGETLWEWNDYLDEYGDWRLHEVHLDDKYVVVNEGQYSYCLDLLDGNTLWNRQNDFYVFRKTWGIGETYFIKHSRALDSLGHYAETIYYGNILDPSMPTKLFTPPFPDTFDPYSNFSGSVDDIYPFTSQLGDTLIAVIYSNYDNDRKADGYIGVYNFSKRNWLYADIKLINNDKRMSLVSISKDKLYTFSSGWVFCRDLYTGNKIWTKGLYNEASGISDIIIADNKLLVNSNEDVLHALDLNTGTELWTAPAGSTCSEMQYLNGIVYFNCSGDSNLYAINTEDGRLLWQIPSPTEKGYTDMMTVLPGENGEKGRVYTATYDLGLCYEAIK